MHPQRRKRLAWREATGMVHDARDLDPSGKMKKALGLAHLPSAKPPKIRLRYGQVMWLLTELGYSAGVSKSTLHEYIKALRKLGIPFGHVKFQTKHKRKLAEYSYYHVMELAIVLSLRVYHVIPDSVLKGIVRYRTKLHKLYRRAYAQRCSGAGSPLVVETKNHVPIELRGLFLDLDIKFSAGHLVRFGPPKLLSSIEALKLFSEGTLTGRTFLPMSLSLLSEQVVSLALAAPTVRSGPPPGVEVGARHKRHGCRN
jgi:hypothetical protein